MVGFSKYSWNLRASSPSNVNTSSIGLAIFPPPLSGYARTRNRTLYLHSRRPFSGRFRPMALSGKAKGRIRTFIERVCNPPHPHLLPLQTPSERFELSASDGCTSLAKMRVHPNSTTTAFPNKVITLAQRELSNSSEPKLQEQDIRRNSLSFPTVRYIGLMYVVIL